MGGSAPDREADPKVFGLFDPGEMYAAVSLGFLGSDMDGVLGELTVAVAVAGIGERVLTASEDGAGLRVGDAPSAALSS